MNVKPFMNVGYDEFRHGVRALGSAALNPGLTNFVTMGNLLGLFGLNFLILQQYWFYKIAIFTQDTHLNIIE